MTFLKPIFWIVFCQALLRLSNTRIGQVDFHINITIFKKVVGYTTWLSNFREIIDYNKAGAEILPKRDGYTNSNPLEGKKEVSQI
jgi:hypothetical protein